LPATGKTTSCRPAAARRVSSRRIRLPSGQSRTREFVGAAHEEDNVPAVTPAKALSLVPATHHADLETPVRHSECRDRCAFDPATEKHHARLTTIESDQDALLELFELALTWHELEYSEMPIIPPDRWMAFVENHRWSDPDRVERIFSVATDLVMMAGRATRQRPEVSDRLF
jgi:hypothetical protein